MRFPIGRLAAGLSLTAVLVVPGVAAAGEDVGSGINVRHVKNIEYPELHAPNERNAGTDLEFATITVSKKDAAERRLRTDAEPGEKGVQRTFAFAGSYGDGLHVIDVTDPEATQRVATYDCGLSQGDVQVFRREDLGGRWFVAFTMDSGYTFHRDSRCHEELGQPFANSAAAFGTFIVEVTDPYDPTTVGHIPVRKGSHNQTVHPSGRYLYNSNSDTLGLPTTQPAIEIHDISVLEQPKALSSLPLQWLPGLGSESHDITFSDDGKRAYVAAVSHTEILDTTDAAKPVSIGKLADPEFHVWHQVDDIEMTDATTGQKRRFLIAEDEAAGAIGTGQCPNGAVHVYDITGDLERNPVKVGRWNITEAGFTYDNAIGVETGSGSTPIARARLGRCTAHVFELHEEEKIMTIAYYNGGVRVVDLSGLIGVAIGRNGVGMKELGHYRFRNSDTWAVKAPFASRSGFYMYGNDQSRGFDVYKYTRPATAAAKRRSARYGGTWLNPAESARASAQLRASGRDRELPLYCVLGRNE